MEPGDSSFPQPLPSLDSELVPRVLELYQQGNNRNEIRTATGIGVPTIRRILLDSGVMRGRGNHTVGILTNPPNDDGPTAGDLPGLFKGRISPDGRRVAVEMYLSGGTSLEVAEVLGVEYQSVTKSVRMVGFDLRGWTDPETHHRDYMVDDTFFDNIDTESKAYLLGFIGADGHVGKFELSFILAAKDVLHLEKIRGILGSDAEMESKPSTAHDFIDHEGKSRHIRSTDMVRLRVNSINLTARLRKLGFEQNKLLRAKVCEVNPELERHYWRGFVDGDGSISYVNGKKSKWWMASLVGSIAVCEGFLGFVRRNGMATTVKVVDARTGDFRPIHLYKVAFGGNILAPQILYLLYSNSTIHLDRKKALADRAIAEFEAKYGPMDAYDFGAA